MARVLLVRPGPGAPEVLPLEAWQALTSSPPCLAPGDPLAGRLADAGLPFEILDEAAAAPAPAEAAPPEAGRRLRLITHEHAASSPAAASAAERLAGMAADRGEVVFVLPREPVGLDDAITRAVFARALEDGLEVEVVIGRQPRGYRLLEVVAVMARLRGPGGCPWDAEQTHETLVRHLIDEAYELIEAVENGHPSSEVAEELGDLLLQVVFHAQMAKDEGTFDVDDVAGGLADKLVRRHPHVFSDVAVSGADEVVANWDAIKEGEKRRSSVLDGVPGALPALAYAQKILRRAKGIHRPNAAEMLAEGRRSLDAGPGEDAFGKTLFGLAALAATHGVDAETALRVAARRYASRVAAVERAARERGLDPAALGEEERARLWEDAGR